MIYGQLDEFESLVPGKPGPALIASLEWLRSLPDRPAIGRYELDESTGMYAMVMEYETVPPEQSRYESHRRAVDLQYTLSGGEGIEWAHSSRLVPSVPFDEDRDLQFYQPGAADAFVSNLPGCFSIYTPTDAHRPKIRIPGHSSVFKAVVKIPVSVFNLVD
jgi:YhcH/YjgK/YiaL family protein